MKDALASQKRQRAHSSVATAAVCVEGARQLCISQTTASDVSAHPFRPPKKTARTGCQPRCRRPRRRPIQRLSSGWRRAPRSCAEHKEATKLAVSRTLGCSGTVAGRASRLDTSTGKGCEALSSRNDVATAADVRQGSTSGSASSSSMQRCSGGELGGLWRFLQDPSEDPPKDPLKVPMRLEGSPGILRSSRNAKVPHEGSRVPRSPPFGSWTLTTRPDQQIPLSPRQNAIPDSQAQTRQNALSNAVLTKLLNTLTGLCDLERA